MYIFDHKVADMIAGYLQDNGLLNNNVSVDKGKYQEVAQAWYDWYKKVNIEPIEIKKIIGQMVSNIDFKDLNGDWGRAKSKMLTILKKLKNSFGITELDPALENKLVRFMEFKMVMGMQAWENYRKRREDLDQLYFLNISSLMQLRYQMCRQQKENKESLLLSNGVKVINKGKTVSLCFMLTGNPMPGIEETMEALDRVESLALGSGASELVLKISENTPKEMVRQTVLCSNVKSIFSTLNYAVVDTQGTKHELIISKLNRLTKQNLSHTQEGLDDGGRLGVRMQTLALKGGNFKEIEKVECEQIFKTALVQYKLRPHQLKFGLKYGNNIGIKKKLHFLVNQLRKGQSLSPEDAVFFKKNCAMLAEIKMKEFTSYEHCFQIYQDLVNLPQQPKNKEETYSRKMVIKDAANMIFAKALVGDYSQVEHDLLSKILVDPRIKSELINRVQHKVYDEIRVHHDLDKVRCVSNNLQKLGIILETGKTSKLVNMGELSKVSLKM